MSIWDWIRNRVNPTPAPRPTPTPITPPPAPPIDPAVVERRQQALRRHAQDSARYKTFVVKAQATGFLPPAPPSPTWYENHPDYVWDPYQPNPERPAPPPDPKISANKRWATDMGKYRDLSDKLGKAPKTIPPPIKYYLEHPDYNWVLDDPQVR